MNVTAKHGQAAVHLGGRDMGNGRWSPACGTQHHNAGGREVTPLRPTDKQVDCKRCLKTLKADKARTDQAEAIANRKAQARENIKATRKALNAEKSGMDSLRDMLKLY